MTTDKRTGKCLFTPAGRYFPPIAVWLFAVAFGVLEYFTLDGLDTIDFTYFYLEKCPDGFDFMGFLRFVNFERKIDNMRVLNMMAPLRYLYVPQWLFATFIGLCSGLTLWLFGRFAAMRRGEGPMLFFVAWLLVVGLPWNDHLLLALYTLNYTIPSTICLSGIWLVWSGGRRARVAGILLVAFAAVCHEGIGTVLLCGAAFMYLIIRGERCRRFCAIMAGGGLLSLAYMCFSRMTDRFSSEVHKPAMECMTESWLLYNFLTVGLIIFLVLILCVPRFRRNIGSFIGEHPLAVFFCGTALGGFFLSGIVEFWPRTSFWPQMCSAVVWTMLAVPVLRRNLKVAKIAGCILGVLFVAYMVWSVPQCRKFTDAYTAAIEQLKDSESGTVFCRTVHPMDFPRYISRFPTRDLFFFEYHPLALSLHFGKPVALVPAELRDMPTDVVPDSLYRSPSGYYVYRPTDSLMADPTRVTAFNISGRGVTVEGDSIEVKAFLLTYIAPDGKRMVMLAPVDIHPSRLRSLNVRP